MKKIYLESLSSSITAFPPSTNQPHSSLLRFFRFSLITSLLYLFDDVQTNLSLLQRTSFFTSNHGELQSSQTISPYIELLWTSLYHEIKSTSSQSIQIHSIHQQQETQHYAVTSSCKRKEEEEDVRMTSPRRQGTKKQLFFYPLWNQSINENLHQNNTWLNWFPCSTRKSKNRAWWATYNNHFKIKPCRRISALTWTRRFGRWSPSLDYSFLWREKQMCILQRIPAKDKYYLAFAYPSTTSKKNNWKTSIGVFNDKTT